MSVVVNDVVSSKMEQYDKVHKNFQKFFNEDELMRIVHNKVDLETLDKVIDSKASRNDFQAQMEITSNLYNRLRLLSIMVVELARVMVPAKSSSSLKNTETINTKI